ncbi:MAG: hypothetical protein VB934_06170, partial [Polyangiaceae bacterium]
MARHLLLGALFVSTSACVKFAKPTTPTNYKETLLSESIDEKPARYGHTKLVEIERHGDSLTIRARKRCQMTRTRSIERTGTVEYRNDNVGLTALNIGAGAAFVAGSVALSVHAASIDPDEENAVKEKIAPMALGAGLLGILGGAWLITGSVTAFSALKSEEKTETIERKEKLPDGPCTQKTQRPVKVKLEPVGGKRPSYVIVGKTDKEGQLTVSLSEVVPGSWLSGSKPANNARVVVAGRKAGTIEIASLSGDVSAKTWAKLAPAIARCKKSTRRRGCYRVERFIKTHPKSPRAAEAKKLLEDHRERQHDHAWTKAKIDTCARPKESSDCRAVNRYLRQYPKGKHAPRARKVLKKVDKKLQMLAKREEAREAQEERAEERREAALERR